MTTDLQHDADDTTPRRRRTRRVAGFRQLCRSGREWEIACFVCTLARTAGLLYLVVAIFGGFAQIVRVNVYEPGDAAATSANILANATWVRLSFVADLVQALVWLVLAVTLYRCWLTREGTSPVPWSSSWRSPPRSPA